MRGSVWLVLALGGLAFVVSDLLVVAFRRIAIAKGITDAPRPDRWHTASTPRLGGVAIALTCVACAALLPGWTAPTMVILAAALAVGMVGLADDVMPVHPVVRVAVEASAAMVVFFAGARVHLVGDAGDLLITVVWLVVITNAFNLLDNADGALGSIATTIAVALSVACLLEGQFVAGGLAAMVAGASVGFLVHNWHPASVFMGDAGSLFVGFLLAAVGLELRTIVEPGPSAVAVILLVGVALFDTVLVVVSRVRAGRAVTAGGTDHTSHRLMRLGVGPGATAAVMVAATVATSTLGVAVARDMVPAAGAAVAAGVVGAVLLVLLLRVPVYPVQALAREAALAS